jgi:hypothetical protein
MAQGHRVVHIEPHSPLEQGKDVISIDSRRRVCAFQLKVGDIALQRWRNEVLPEVRSLVDVPVNHPATGVKYAVPHLVTTGSVTPPALAEITSYNAGLKSKRQRQLIVLTRTDLAAQFKAAHGVFLPSEPREIRDLFRLYLEDGEGVLPKARFSALIGRMLAPRSVRRNQVAQAVTSSSILASYALRAFTDAQNHHAIFEGWTMVGAYIARLADTLRAPDKEWEPAFRLSVNSAASAALDLAHEALAARMLMPSGALGDGGPLYRARITILLGTAAAAALYSKYFGGGADMRLDVRALIDKHISHALLWGESAVPCFLMIALLLEATARPADGEALILSVMRAIADANSPASDRPLPSPYYSPSRCLAATCQLARPVLTYDHSAGQSHALGPLVDYLVRRLRRQGLAQLWPAISKIQFVHLKHRRLVTQYQWRTRHGTMYHVHPKARESWRRLTDSVARVQVRTLPRTLAANPGFAMFFLLTYPHRLNRSILKLIETGLEAARGS